jgi:hypothetical protein
MFIGAFGASRLRYVGVGAGWGCGSHPGCGCERRIVLFSKLIHPYFKPAKLICPLIAKRGQITIYIGLSTCGYDKYSV